MRIDGLQDRDIQALVDGLDMAFTETMELLGREFISSITSRKWNWPTGDSPRDIVDQGRLRDSQDLTIEKFRATFSWNTTYAAAVHEGVVFKNGTTLPPRRWTEDAMNEFDYRAVFNVLFERYSGLRQI